jgi:hypothetical protein
VALETRKRGGGLSPHMGKIGLASPRIGSVNRTLNAVYKIHELHFRHIYVSPLDHRFFTRV